MCGRSWDRDFRYSIRTGMYKCISCGKEVESTSSVPKGWVSDPFLSGSAELVVCTECIHSKAADELTLTLTAT